MPVRLFERTTTKQELESPDGNAAMATVSLEEGGIILTRVPSRDLVIRRYFKDGRMLVDMTCKGHSTTRVFEKQQVHF